MQATQQLAENSTSAVPESPFPPCTNSRPPNVAKPWLNLGAGVRPAAADRLNHAAVFGL